MGTPVMIRPARTGAAAGALLLLAASCLPTSVRHLGSAGHVSLDLRFPAASTALSVDSLVVSIFSTPANLDLPLAKVTVTIQPGQKEFTIVIPAPATTSYLVIVRAFGERFSGFGTPTGDFPLESGLQFYGECHLQTAFGGAAEAAI